jgi:hypothetical protein
MRDMLLYIAKVNTVGISETVKGEVGIYPNPTTSILYCAVNHNALNTHYTITNIQGADMGLAKVVPSSSFDIDVSQLPSGIYYLAVHDAKQRMIKKFVKQ